MHVVIKSEDRAAGDKRDAMVGYVRAWSDNKFGEMGNERQRGQNATSEVKRTIHYQLILVHHCLMLSLIQYTAMRQCVARDSQAPNDLCNPRRRSSSLTTVPTGRVSPGRRGGPRRREGDLYEKPAANGWASPVRASPFARKVTDAKGGSFFDV